LLVISTKSLMELVLNVCMGTISGACICTTQKDKWLCDLMRKAPSICLRSCLRQILKLKTYPALNTLRAGRYSYHRKYKQTRHASGKINYAL